MLGAIVCPGFLMRKDASLLDKRRVKSLHPWALVFCDHFRMRARTLWIDLVIGRIAAGVSSSAEVGLVVEYNKWSITRILEARGVGK